MRSDKMRPDKKKRALGGMMLGSATHPHTPPLPHGAHGAHAAHSPAAAGGAPLETCRVAPYLTSLPALAPALPSLRLTTPSTTASAAAASAAAAASVASAAYERLSFPPFSAFDPALLAHQYAAAAAALGSGPGGLYQYPLGLANGLAALAAVHQDRLQSKNSSIADLRLKAKKHAEALGLGREKAV
ncbi:Short stature homeobox protein [Frankliniella fusca]|uniref:Short stature homeobox protein n=1 Tax=Frankliniella fusca TaxID=407009 RepID=A0AAE1HTR0_9NEOP|nr:Short stature homeobox protein [Frankliniella fusca]